MSLGNCLEVKHYKYGNLSVVKIVNDGSNHQSARPSSAPYSFIWKNDGHMLRSLSLLVSV
jgi:hypothetical protein